MKTFIVVNPVISLILLVRILLCYLILLEQTLLCSRKQKNSWKIVVQIINSKIKEENKVVIKKIITDIFLNNFRRKIRLI